MAETRTRSIRASSAAFLRVMVVSMDAGRVGRNRNAFSTTTKAPSVSFA
jgi:hypothetical protein